MIRKIVCCFLLTGFLTPGNAQEHNPKTRVIITTDGEIDDECSMVRCLLYANEWDIEGIVTSSSQYHWHGHKWAGDNWMNPYLDAYEKVYPNLTQHDKGYPAPQYLRQRTVLGNVKLEGEMDEMTWLDPVPVKGYAYPQGRWYGSTAWGRISSKNGSTAETDSNYH